MRDIFTLWFETWMYAAIDRTKFMPFCHALEFLGKLLWSLDRHKMIGCRDTYLIVPACPNSHALAHFDILSSINFGLKKKSLASARLMKNSRVWWLKIWCWETTTACRFFGTRQFVYSICRREENRIRLETKKYKDLTVILTQAALKLAKHITSFIFSWVCAKYKYTK